ncbi:MAG: hypothetical protein GY725_05580 [bacterium]|nr:hypothetical protein [bacterium]
MGCEEESELAATAARLDQLGVKCRVGGSRLEVVDPVNKWLIVVEPAAAFDVSQQPKRLLNRPGERERLDVRAEVLVEPEPRPPRRLGHLLVCSSKSVETIRFMTEGIGFRVSDIIAGGLGAFLRCSGDHHNLAIAPGPVPYLNHYAFEYDDFDAVMRAASVYVRRHGEGFHIAGPGRHPIGGNVFRYMLDPSGTIFEFFTDMDRIASDEAWVIKDDWDLGDGWSIWGQKETPEIFFNPVDMPEIVAGWEKEHA